MKDLLDVLRYVNTAAFFMLALVAARLWRTRKDEASKWVFLTFGDLALVGFAGLFLPMHSDSQVVRWERVVLVVILLLFPYFLYRISASFGPTSRAWDRVAVALTAVVTVWTIAMPRIPEQGDPQPAYFRAFILLLLIDWVVLSVVVAVRFGKAGRSLTGVAGRRMIMLSVASVVLSLGIVLSGTAPGQRPAGLDVAVQLMALASLVAFFLAFSPPTWLRIVWRQPTQERFRQAVLALIGASTKEEVVQGLLPHAIELVGGEGIALIDKDGAVIATHALDLDPSESTTTEPDKEGRVAPDLVRLDFPFGSLLVRTGPYTPFFGRDEIELLGSLGALANLAIERTEAADLRVQVAEAQARRQQALQINDNVVQGLAVAKYAIELGDDVKAKEAVSGTLTAARSIISDLIDETGVEIIAPGSLVRDRAATYGAASTASAPGDRSETGEN